MKTIKPIARMTRREYRAYAGLKTLHDIQQSDPWAGDRDVQKQAAHERWASREKHMDV